MNDAAAPPPYSAKEAPVTHSTTPLTLDAALEAARACPEARVSCFVRSWPAVDRARELIEALGLAHRISVHHRLAAAIGAGHGSRPCSA
jgi:hypothetical protein